MHLRNLFQTNAIQMQLLIDKHLKTYQNESRLVKKILISSLLVLIR
jgi:hypothetical protein